MLILRGKDSLARRGRRARDLAYLLRRRKSADDERERRHVGITLLETAAEILLPGYVVTEDAKRWFDDASFLDSLDRLGQGNMRSADRKFLLRELLKLVADLPGDTAEAGVYEGASSWLVCDFFRDTSKVHYAIDSFEGLSPPTVVDGSYWRPGDLAAPEHVVRSRLAPFEAVLCQGWIPEAFAHVPETRFCFVHVDLDLYEPTLASIQYFYPRLVSGGVLLCDDYGFSSCPGAVRAIDEYMCERPEPVIHIPTGQGLIIRG